MVERVTAILDAFNLPLARLSLDEITRAAGLPRSTTHRILWQLVQNGWVRHANNLYSLGPRAMRLGARELVHEQLRAACSQRLRELAHRTGLVVHLAAMDGPEVYYMDKFAGPNAPEVPSEVGSRDPAHCTAAGKAILAGLPPETVHELYADGLGPAPTDRSLTEVSVLHQELVRIRFRKGLALEHGECAEKVSCVGAAINDACGPVAAVSIAAPYGTALDRFGPIVLATAKAISERLVRAEMASGSQSVS